MSENNTISLYASAVSDGQKRRLLTAYRNYISMVRNLESIVSRHHISALASVQVESIFPDIKNTGNPWDVEPPSAEARKAYQEFLSAKSASKNRNYCFISWNTSSAAADADTSGIMSVPESYILHYESNSLPHRIERYVAAFPEEALLKDTTFVINGKYALKYKNPASSAAVNDMFNDTLAEKGFRCMLDILVQLPENLYAVTEKELRTAQDEALASELTAPFENMILSALSSLAEEAERIAKKTASRRSTDNYFYQAENNGLFPSAARFQDYLNIRHLMYHQLDTLDNLGRCTMYNIEKNASLRRRYLDSYSRLCEKPLKERVKSYIAAAADFAPLVVGLNPDFLMRRAGESNSKFVSRIKEYQRAHPDTPFMAETGYADTDEKKKSLIKNIQKLFPSAEIIDVKEMNIESFMERIKIHLVRKKFLDVFAQIEYMLCQRSLLRGKSLSALKCWQDAAKDGLLSSEEAALWAEYKKLRNDLSHNLLNEIKTNELMQNFAPFLEASVMLEDRVTAQNPQIYIVEGNVYRAVHADGLEVEVDFAQKRVLKVSNKAVQHHHKQELPPSKARTYSEEYPNGVSITVAGTEVISCRLSGGTQIDLQARKITYPDKTRFYFNSSDHYTLSAGNAKIMTDNHFAVVNYIQNGKSVTVGKNETLILSNGCTLRIGADGRLKEESRKDNRGLLQKIVYTPQALEFADGTILSLSSSQAVLSHNGIKLTYLTRKEFAESYHPPFPPAMLHKKHQR